MLGAEGSQTFPVSLPANPIILLKNHSFFANEAILRTLDPGNGALSIQEHLQVLCDRPQKSVMASFIRQNKKIDKAFQIYLLSGAGLQQVMDKELSISVAGRTKLFPVTLFANPIILEKTTYLMLMKPFSALAGIKSSLQYQEVIMGFI
jgi:hypothetical protein